MYDRHLPPPVQAGKSPYKLNSVGETLSDAPTPPKIISYLWPNINNLVYYAMLCRCVYATKIIMYPSTKDWQYNIFFSELDAYFLSKKWESILGATNLNYYKSYLCNVFMYISYELKICSVLFYSMCRVLLYVFFYFNFI